MPLYSITKALDIQGYKIKKIEEQTGNKLHILIEPYKRRLSNCSNCGKIHKKGFHGSTKVIVRDLPLFNKKVFLHVLKRRWNCPEDGRIYNESIPWLKKHSRVTNRFAETVNRLTAITTNQEAGWFFDLDDETVYRIDKECLEEKAKDRLNPVPTATNISVDEVSYRKYHKYLTNVIDIDERLLIWNAKGRKAEVLNQYYENIGEENCANIESVALDGAKTYISSTQHYATNALIVYDKFHISQKLNKAVDKVRKVELQKARNSQNEELVELINCRQRFILLKKKKNLTEKQSGYLEKLCSLNNFIYQAMLLKENFLQIYSYTDIDDVTDHLKNWLDEATASSLESFKELAESFKAKAQYIINWFKKKVSSAISEGFNNKIKRLKRMAYGYRDVDYFRLKIHQHCGLLNPRRFPH